MWCYINTSLDAAVLKFYNSLFFFKSFLCCFFCLFVLMFMWKGIIYRMISWRNPIYIHSHLWDVSYLLWQVTISSKCVCLRKLYYVTSLNISWKNKFMERYFSLIRRYSTSPISDENPNGLLNPYKQVVI